MTDQIPADQARDLHGFADKILAATADQNCTAIALANLVKETTPPPPRPTLADMNEKERRACKWAQADVAGEAIRPVIVNPFWEEGSARALWPGGFMEEIEWERITPRPDLPRMEWPGNKKPVPALPEGWRLADHKENGRVIVTNPTPTRDGRVYYVLPAAAPLGYDWLFCTPDELTYIDQEADQ